MKQNILLYYNLIKHFAVATTASAAHWIALSPAALVENSSVYRQCSCRSVSHAVCVIAVRRHTSRDQPLNQQAALSFFLSVKHWCGLKGNDSWKGPSGRLRCQGLKHKSTATHKIHTNPESKSDHSESDAAADQSDPAVCHFSEAAVNVTPKLRHIDWIRCLINTHPTELFRFRSNASALA